MGGNVFLFSFDQNGFEAIVNLTEIDEQCVLAKMADETPPQSVGSIISMCQMRARFNQPRNMEVWLAKLDESLLKRNFLCGQNVIPKLLRILLAWANTSKEMRAGSTPVKLYNGKKISTDQ